MKLISCYILLLTTLCAPAQLMDWGNAQKLNSRNFYCKYVGYNNDGYYYLRCKKTDFKTDIIIEKYSRTLNLVWSKNIPNERITDVLQQVLLLKNKLLILTTEENYANGFTEIKALSLSFDGDLGTQPSLLFQIKSNAFYSDDANDRFMYKINDEKTRFAVCYVTQSEKKYANLNYNIFGENANNLGSGGFPYNFRTDQFFVNDILMQEHSLYALVSYNEAKKGSEDAYHHDVIIIDPGNKTFNRVHIMIEGKIQSDLGIYLDTVHHAIQLTGFYSEKKSTSAAGIILYNLPLDNPEHYSVAFTPFPKELLSKIIGERASEKTKEVEDFVVNRIVPRSDGGLLFIAECFYIEKQPYSTYTSGIQGAIPQQTVVRSVFNYDEVMVFSIDTDAHIDWWQVITKNQNSVNDEGYNLSIATMVKRDMVYVFFNIGYRNSNDIMEYSISSTGKMKNKVLFKSTGYYIDFTPRQSSQIATGSLLMPVVKDRKFNLLKITY